MSTHTCDYCGKTIETPDLRSWERLPPGWLIRLDTECDYSTTRFEACSDRCADAYDAREEEKRRIEEAESRERWHRLSPEEQEAHRRFMVPIVYPMETIDPKTFVGMEPRYVSRIIDTITNPPVVERKLTPEQAERRFMGLPIQIEVDDLGEEPKK